jgi:4-alpha-glucanotransferase
VTDPELLRRAQNAGIAADYYDWHGQYTEVPAETLLAILEVLERPLTAGDFSAAHRADSAQPDSAQPGPTQPGPAQPGPAQPEPAQPEPGQPGTSRPVHSDDDRDHPRPPIPAEQQWGFTVQLYSLRSQDSWGHGDLHDLAELARWSAAELGAGFVLVNPLHAGEPLPPVSASPYLPMTRLFTSPLYLRVEDIPEYEALSPAAEFAIQDLAAPLKAANRSPDLIDRDAVWQAKRAALELISKAPLSRPRQAAYDQFRAERGIDLRYWSAWCALAERHGADWRSWPAELTEPGRACQAVDDDPKLRRAAEFHAWLQWHADEQLAAAQLAATAAGMSYGIIHDLAVGVHPGGADAWASAGLLVQGFSVGAPPDGFNQLGQDWAQPPWNPRRLAAADYRPIADLFGAALRHGGGLRVDHVMGLMRLWWVPDGQRPDRGAYVYYDHRASVAALADSAARTGALAIGEDLGTVEDWVRGYLAEQRILGTTMLWFARDDDGGPLPPQHWRRGCMATVGTHDVPPVSGFFTGDQVTVRARLGLLKTSEETERAESAAMLARWQAALRATGLLGRDQAPDAAQFTVALYGYLRKTPSLLLGVSLADAVGDVRTQNVPGTSTEYPNWKIPLCDAGQRSVLLEQLPGVGLLREVCRAVSAG